MKHDFNIFHLQWAIRSIKRKDINGYEKAIINILLSCVGKENDTWYSLESLSETTCFSLDTVRRNIRSLEQKQFIIITKPSKYSRSVSNHYALNIDKIMSFLPQQKDSSQQPIKDKRVADSNVRVADSNAERVADSTTKKERKERKEEDATLASDEAARLKEIEACKARRAEDAIKGVPMPEYVKELILKLRAERSFNEILKH